MVRRALAIQFITLPTGCYIPISHRLNEDGYLRYKHRDSQIMFHRLMWYVRVGDIPDGHEINHLCNNRACCNVDHLECISRAEHLDKTNRARYAGRQLAARSYWERNRCTGTKLAKEFGVSSSIGCKWIRIWKAELTDQ